jgi:Zn-dependent oligopeptidase
MGYKDYASYSLERTMAKTPDRVYAFLKQLIAAYAPRPRPRHAPSRPIPRRPRAPTSS